MMLKTLLLAAVCAAASPWVLAQGTPAAQPAANAAAAPGAANLTMGDGKGKGKGGGALLTREELRACLAQEASLKTRLDDTATQRAALNQEKDQITAEREALRADREPIDAMRKSIEDLNARMTAYGEQVKSWNQRVSDFNASPPDPKQADKIRLALNAEREDLQKQQKDLEADKAKLVSADTQGSIQAFNAKATALDAKVADWNQRNQAFTEKATALEDERSGWMSSCANRRYREDDETAIKKGK